MKKNKMMRLASGLLVLTLLTTSIVSGTFAKYVTSASSTDTARVAKWGVAVTASDATFATEYAKDDNSFTLAENTVVSTEDVVAPGTKGNMANISVSGTPEVAVKVTYKGEFDISDNWTVNSDFYCPLVIKVGDETIKGTDYDNAAAFETAVNTAINSYSKEYVAGTNLADKNTDALKVSWEWPFEGGTTDAEKKAIDEKDTFLGGQAASNNPATVTLKVTATVTQID